MKQQLQIKSQYEADIERFERRERGKRQIITIILFAIVLLIVKHAL